MPYTIRPTFLQASTIFEAKQSACFFVIGRGARKIDTRTEEGQTREILGDLTISNLASDWLPQTFSGQLTNQHAEL